MKSIVFRTVCYAFTPLMMVAITASLTFAADHSKYAGIMDENPNPVPHYPTQEDKEYIRQINEQRKMQVFESMAPHIAAPIGPVWAPGEYEAVYGPLVAWEPGSYLSLLTEFIVGVTNDPDMNSVAFVIVRDAAQEASARSTLESYGADMDRVKFIYYDLDTVWIRDYGPRYISESSISSIIDHTYNRNRPKDNSLPSYISTDPVPFAQNEPVHLMDLVHGGGNFHAFSNGDAFMSTLIYDENSSKSQTEIHSIIESYHNVNVTVYDRLPSNVDATGHIDMWFLPIADDKVIIAAFSPSVGFNGYTQTEAAASDMASRGYTVYRVPNHNSGSGGTGGTHYTYTNAAIINERVFIPEFGGSHAANDATALQRFQIAMPDHEIIQVDCSSIISAAGAIHCVMKHVYTLPTPFVEGLKPIGGEVLYAGDDYEIKWIANDDDFSIESVSIYYSTDGGATYPYTIATGESHDGYYTWTVPYDITEQCRIMIVVDDGEGNNAEHITQGDFSIVEPLGNPDLVYTPVQPCRLIDTRLSKGGLGPIIGGTQRDFSVAGLCDVPSGTAKAVMINIAAVNATGMGNLRAFAYPKPKPFAATLNYGIIPGLNAISNAAIIPICDTDVSACFWDLSIWVSTTTDVVVDVMGYFATP